MILDQDEMMLTVVACTQLSFLFVVGKIIILGELGHSMENPLLARKSKNFRTLLHAWLGIRC